MAEEWMRMLQGFGEPSEPAASDAFAEESVLGDLEVSDEGDASQLLAAVKQRLAEAATGHLYHEFLTATSGSRVDREAALAVLKPYPDLVQAFQRCFKKGGDAALLLDEDASGTSGRAAQLVQLVYANALMSGHEHEVTKMLDYVGRKAAESAFPRRLVLLRGPPGTGTTEYALEELKMEGAMVGVGKAEMLAFRLTHICSTDDFFMQFSNKATADRQYAFNAQSYEASKVMNEARVRMAMELGVDPLYVDNTNMQLSDMQPYILLADRMGYVVTVVSPSKVNAQWDDLDVLAASNAERKKGKQRYLGRGELAAMVQGFESLPEGADARPLIRAAERSSLVEEGKLQTSEYNTKLPPSAVLYKFEKLLREGQELLRYTPPDGKGWGVTGELEGDWHSFREKADGSCQYNDRLKWWTEDPEGGWTVGELAMLNELKREVEKLPQADLPTATSHPGLFSKSKKAAAAPARKIVEESPRQVSRAGAWETGPDSVPTSRTERFRTRMRLLEEKKAKASEVFEEAAAPAKRPRVQRAAAEEEEEDDVAGSNPTAQEEVSASAFLAAVKARLTEWGKVEQYHEFVLALSGTVDAKAAVRILRGHDDLLRVFRRKFAPEADLVAIKAEIRTEDDAPHPPAHPPAHAARPPMLGMVKQELGAKPEGPRPPKAPPGKSMVKAEIVKSEDVPRPPKTSPHAPRGVVSVGDEEDEEFVSEASIGAAVKKGRDECVAQLAKVIFKRERAAHEGARERLSMVRYATKVASRPRFPRELFILRGPPGVGKTDYAMQQLADFVSVDPEESVAARLTHVCAVDDFFETFVGDDVVYKFEAAKLEAMHRRNESRVRLAMEAGIHPLFVDCSNLHLWEMKPYVALAERLGYVATVVEPGEICEKWDDVDFLVSSNDTSERQLRQKVVEAAVLTAMVKAFEPIGLSEPIKAVKEAAREEAPRVVEAAPEAPPKRPAAVPSQPPRGVTVRPGPYGKGKGGGKGKRW